MLFPSLEASKHSMKKRIIKLIQNDTEKHAFYIIPLFVNPKYRIIQKNTVVFIQHKEKILRWGPASPVEMAGRLFKVGQELAEESDGKT